MTDATPEGKPRAGRGRGRAVGPWASAAFLAAAAVLALLFYREFVFHPSRLLAGTDMLGEGFPLRRFGLEEVRAGRGLPLWNPLAYAGLPYVATLPGPVFYPSTLLYLVLPLYRAVGWTFVLHTFLAGAFGYFAGRSFRLARTSSAVVGLAFMFAAYQVSTLYGGHDGRMFAMVLIPLVFGLAERGLRGGSPGWFLGAGLAVALQIFTPHTQVMYFSSLALVGWAAFCIWRPVEGTLSGAGAGRGVEAGAGSPDGGEAAPGRQRLRLAALTALVFAVAAAVGAVQLLPTVGLLDHVVRAASERGYEFAASWALPPQEVTALFLPDLVGSLDTYWGTNPFKLHTEYVGAVPLALAALAVAGALPGGGPAGGATSARGEGNGEGPASGHGFERGAVLALAAGSALGILFSLGGATPVHRIAYELVPMMKDFRAPGMMMGPVSFFVALLAGFGWERVLAARAAGKGRREPRRPSAGKGREGRAPGRQGLPWTWIAALSAPFVLAGLAAAVTPGGLLDLAYHTWFPSGWPRRPPEGLPGRLRVDGIFLLAGWGVVLATAAGVARGRLARGAVLVVLALLVVDLWRVDARYLETLERSEALQPGPVVERLVADLGPGERAWPIQGIRPNTLAFFGIPTVNGSQKFLLEPYARLVGGLDYENLLRNPELWRLFDTRYLTTTSDVESPLLRPTTVGSGPVRLYETARGTPHAFFPARVEVVADTARALRRVLALPEATDLAVVEPRQGRSPPGAGAGSARVESYAPDEVVLAVEAEEGGLLFVSDAHHPGWRAYVDAEEVPVWRTNVAFRGVEVPAGAREVRLVYRDAWFRAGAWISALGLLGAVAGMARPLLRRRRGPRRQAPA